MNFDSTAYDLALALDAADVLAGYQNEFVVADPDLIYLDGNSLGRLPKRSVEVLRRAVDVEWGERLIRSWNESWIDLPARLGGKVAQLIGAQPGEVLVTEATSINLFKLAAAALQARPGRGKIVSDEFNFPSDLYIFQGLSEFMRGEHRLEVVRSGDGLTIDPVAVKTAIDEATALVSLTHVAFKSAFRYDMAQVTEMAHEAGALMLWDLSHSAGAVPLDLNGCNVDLAVGCTYKYLNGGPGSPAFLYVRSDLQQKLMQPMWGWFAAQAPFNFDLQFEPAADLSRFRVGTLPVLSMRAVEPALDLLLEAGMERLRAKSVQQSEYMIYLYDQWLVPLGFGLGSPRDAEQRGSHISLRHPQGYRITRALIEAQPPAVRVIPDFRTPDNIRLGIAPLYNSFADIWRAMLRLREIVQRREYERFPEQRLAVT